MLKKYIVLIIICGMFELAATPYYISNACKKGAFFEDAKTILKLKAKIAATAAQQNSTADQKSGKF